MFLVLLFPQAIHRVWVLRFFIVRSSTREILETMTFAGESEFLVHREKLKWLNFNEISQEIKFFFEILTQDLFSLWQILGLLEKKIAGLFIVYKIMFIALFLLGLSSSWIRFHWDRTLTHCAIKLSDVSTFAANDLVTDARIKKNSHFLLIKMLIRIIKINVRNLSFIFKQASLFLFFVCFLVDWHRFQRSAKIVWIYKIFIRVLHPKQLSLMGTFYLWAETASSLRETFIFSGPRIFMIK